MRRLGITLCFAGLVLPLCYTAHAMYGMFYLIEAGVAPADAQAATRAVIERSMIWSGLGVVLLVIGVLLWWCDSRALKHRSFRLSRHVNEG